MNKMKKRMIRKGIKKGLSKGKEKIKGGISRARKAGRAGKEKVKNGIANVRTKVQLIKPFFIVDGITLSNAMFGMLSIFASISEKFKLACLFLLLASFMDFLDGKFARKFGRNSKLGKELDSLADIVSFGAAPAVLGFVYVGNLWIIIPLALYVSCGIIRLAKFNVQLVKKAYLGMPITLNAIIYSALYFTGAQPNYWFYAYVISAVLMVSPFKIKKVV
jgi:CDP-diacylglycerol--serine O-phosphatidyltransferase